VLSSLYVLSFVDRFVLALLVAPLRSDLGLSDVQLGLLFGPAFGLFYAVLGLPLARFADRGNRRRLIVVGVLLWGIATTASGFANSFAWLVSLRVGLAIGESALTPAAYSLIGDLFPERRRTLAASIYSAVGQAGAYGSFIIGAAILHAVDSATAGGRLSGLKSWQLVLVAVGVPSIAVAFVFLCTTREPPRNASRDKSAPPLREVVRYLGQHVRLYLGLFGGAGLLQAVSYSWNAWGPEYIRREFSWPIQHAGLAFGLSGLLATSAGTMIFPLITRWLASRGRSDAIASTSTAGVIVGSLFAIAAILRTSPASFLILMAAALFCTAGATNNVIVALQIFAPDRMRATLVACLLLCITLLGLCLGPPLTALLATSISPQGHGLGAALGILTVAIAVPCTALFSISRASLRAAATGDAARSNGP
jgi:predicted MFS family arabinose efflux permease